MPNYSGMMGSGVQVIVDEKDIELAKTLIAETTTDESRCPNCNSTNIRFGLGNNRFRRIFTIIISLLFWIPFGNIRNTHFCKDCNTEFKIDKL
jgi:hypothetical protein